MLLQALSILQPLTYYFHMIILDKMRGNNVCKPKKNEAIEPSSGNVFADLGYSDAEQRLAKADIAISISHAIQGLGLSQIEAAATLGIDQPSISRLLKGRLSGFTIEHLLEINRMLGHMSSSYFNL